jgi:tRNA pseudouridine55 synthase
VVRVKRTPPLHGLLVIDKPRGPTSHDVVMRIRRALHLREVGHAGTLDPMASGVLVVAVGEATKLVPWLTGHDKAYVASIALGVETDTLDAEGQETAREDVGEPLALALAETRPGGVVSPMLAAALSSEQARTSQVPPAYSAVKTGGERAYAMARRGEAPALDARPVRVERLELIACTAAPPSLSVGLDVAKGYYVRALARDLARGLGTVGHLTSLRRVRSGSFSCDEAVSPEAPADELLAHLQPIQEAAARTLPVATLTDVGVDHARHGRAVGPGDIATQGPGPSAWLDARGLLVAVGEVDADGRGRVLRGFAEQLAAIL